MSEIETMSNSVKQIKEKTFDVPAMHLRAALAPASLNKEKRTVRVTYATETPCIRWDWGLGEYMEILSTDPAHVRLERMNNGAPVLNAHKNSDTVYVVGVCENATTRECDMRFALDDADAEKVWNKIEQNILRNVSVGYVVHRYEEVTKPGDEIRTFKAVDWEPMEVSVVPIPADAGAGIRSGEIKKTRCVVMAAQAADHVKGQKTMTKKVEDENAPAANPETVEQRAQDKQTPAVKADPEAVAKAVEAERARAAEIQTIGLKTKAAADEINKAIANGVTPDAFRAAMIDKLADEDDKMPTRAAHTIQMGDSADQKRSAAIEQALLHRHNPGKFKAEGQAREFRGMSLREIARDQLEFKGISTRGMSPNEIAKRALHSTSDFPEILANVAGKTLRAGYEETKRSFTAFSRQTSLPDFKQVARLQLSEAPNLDKVAEGAEYKYGTLGEGAEKYQLFTYGKLVGITREVIINDDMDAFTRVPALFGAAAARKESDLVYAILTGNPNMADGVPLFHANHGNLTNALLGVAGIGALRALMRVQKGIAGAANINVEGKYLIVPAALEMAALQLKSAFYAGDTTKVNPFADSFEVIVEARLDANSTLNYYMAADPSQIDTIEYAYLDGETGPYIESREGFERDGVEFKVRHDFAAKAIDPKGLAKSTNNA